MKQILFLSLGVCLVCAGAPTWAAVVSWGSQNLAVALEGGVSPPREFATISVAGATDSWDDFTITLEYIEGAEGDDGVVYAPFTYLTIAPASDISLDMPSEAWRWALGESWPPLVENFAVGDWIGPSASFADTASGLPLLSVGVYGGTYEGLFDESGGYIGLAILAPGATDYQYGWLHLSGMSNLGYSNQTVTFDGWAYEYLAGEGIYAGEIGIMPLVPAPGALALACLGAGLLAQWRRRSRPGAAGFPGL